MNTADEEPVKFVATDTIQSTLGYVTKGDSGNSEYYFTEDTEVSKVQLIEDIESITHKAKELLNLPPEDKKLVMYFNSYSDKKTISTNDNRIVLTVDSEKSLGALVSHLSNYKLPAWLSVGLELYLMDTDNSEPPNISGITEWLRKTKEQGLPTFGDTWFIPGYIDHDLKPFSKDIAYYFVSYLEDAGHLQEVVDLFMEENSDVIELLKKHWRDFTNSEGAQIDVSTKYLFELEETYFEVHAEKVKYQFKNGDWDYHKINDYVNYIEDSIKFVGKWFNYEIDQQLTINLYPTASPSRAHKNGFAYNGNLIEVYRVNDPGPFAAVHEIVHVYTNNTGITTNFFPFYEGLAEAISYEFDSTEKGYLYDVFREDMNNYLVKKDEVGYYSKILKNYQRISGETYEPIAEMDLYAAVFSNSIWEFEQKHHMFPSFITTDSNYTEDLNGYAKAGSFVLYLLEKQGKDDFIKVYENIENFKGVYGKDLSTMIEEWESFIGAK